MGKWIGFGAIVFILCMVFVSSFWFIFLYYGSALIMNRWEWWPCVTIWRGVKEEVGWDCGKVQVFFVRLLDGCPLSIFFPLCLIFVSYCYESLFFLFCFLFFSLQNWSIDLKLEFESNQCLDVFFCYINLPGFETCMECWGRVVLLCCVVVFVDECMGINPL